VVARLVQSVPRVVAAVDATMFFGLVWGTLAFVVIIFAYLLYGVVRAGGIGLSNGGH
jgi:hypothetical protein